MRKVKLSTNLILSVFSLFMVGIIQSSEASEVSGKVVANGVNVYPALPGNQFMSDRYEVKVSSDGVSQTSYVYKDPNNDPRWLTKWPRSEAYINSRKPLHFIFIQW